ISMIFITHDIALASDISDQIAVVQRGKVCEIGPAEEVLRRPQHAYTKRLLGSVPPLRSGGSVAQELEAYGLEPAVAAGGWVAPPRREKPNANGMPRPSETERNLVSIEDLKVYFHVRRGLFRRAAVKAVDGVT